ncbi:MAG: AmmeMemoRadiSam system radical SAM enzyme [Chloroflexota bacterium]
MHAAQWWEPMPDQAVRCRLCPWYCFLKPGETGRCHARGNRDGKLCALTYGKCSSRALDPIEKKPLYHFHPGSTILSIGSNGCNLGCAFCQNWEISQGETPVQEWRPADVAQLALSPAARRNGCVGIAYTYSEPLVWAEYVLDTAREVHRLGLANVVVTNGYINPEPLADLLPHIDALNIDVKAFTDRYYRDVCHGRLEPVKETVVAAHRAGCHVEVTTLLVPGLNDEPGEIDQLTDWLAGISPDIPLHFSRYYPNYRMDLPPTPVPTLIRAREQALKKLRYVYLGNVRIADADDTHCPQCGEPVIRRAGMGVVGYSLHGTRCARCDTPIALVGLARE